AATQGRALWVLDDLDPLRQVDAAILGEPVHLFAPSPAVRVRPNNNRDTPLPVEEPAGRNPPPGASVDYWLGAPAKGPVAIEIRDSAGNLAARLTSETPPAPPAERYFSKSWVKPQEPLSRMAGLHRAVWNLRYPRPPAVEYAYSISTAAGTDTPIAPEGPLALPGDYRVTLTVDGRSRAAVIHLSQDPRSKASPEALAASLALSRRIAAALAITRRGYGEELAAGDQLAAVHVTQDKALATRVDALIARLTIPQSGRGFIVASRTLTGIETDLEGADLAPTEPQVRTVARTAREVDALFAQWSALRDGALARLDADLARAGLRPVVIPPEDRLAIRPPAGGEDLP
ncbi:MAG: hypothetical protein ABI376_03440, partial [Caulobacteraceae bacterium]